jgi:hypothetical protein
MCIQISPYATANLPVLFNQHVCIKLLKTIIHHSIKSPSWRSRLVVLNRSTCASLRSYHFVHWPWIRDKLWKNTRCNFLLHLSICLPPTGGARTAHDIDSNCPPASDSFAGEYMIWLFIILYLLLYVYFFNVNCLLLILILNRSSYPPEEL